MAKIIMEDQEKEVADGAAMQEPCEELGVPFGCQSGICGTCYIKVLKGEENLSPVTQAETDMAVEKHHRLACQCRIEKGEVKIKQGY